mmetsp:Transcript_3124/g.9593  ORF Transcript_3124/g.9593 Transcript_3124/m.9593 type:complete len:575 (+) Transcript_3124:168-1892(+)
MASTARPEASTAHPEAASTTPTAEETLDELLRDAPRNAEARARQEAAWDLQGKEDARRLLYEREVAERHSKLLAASINAFWRAEVLAQGHEQGALPLPKETVALIGEFAEPTADLVVNEAIRRREGGAAKPVSRLAPPSARVAGPHAASRPSPPEENACKERRDGGVKIYARIRPTAGEGSVRVVERSSGDAVMLHEAKLSRSHRTFACRHHRVAVDGVFERSSTEVLEKVVDPLIDDVLRGSAATLLLFGQTGTGKTHTLREALTRFVSRIDTECTVRFVELAGKACRDLLNDASSVKLLSDSNDVVHFKGAPPRVCPDSKALRNTLDEGLALRSSVQTERNAASSRSHAVVEISINDVTMTFVDLAGSERKWETMQMRGRQHQRESADINLSLMALKDCFRARYEGRRIPYRAHNLTRVLRKCFDECSVAIVSTLSAAPEDLIHSLYSLETVCLMAPDLMTKSVVETSRLFAETGSVVGGDPMEWGAEQFHRWLLTAENGRFSHVVVPEGTTGKELLGMNGAALGALFAGTGREGRASNEGSVWTIEAMGGRGLAKEMVAALRREACRWRIG